MRFSRKDHAAVRRLDVVVVLSRLAGIIEQNNAAEPEARGELLQPVRHFLPKKPRMKSSPMDMRDSAIDSTHYRGSWRLRNGWQARSDARRQVAVF
jgi:hypothetical protein